MKPKDPPADHLVLLPADDHWPPGWNHLHDAPRRAHVQGETSVLTRRSLAIVGTRRASARGQAVARRMAADLARQGWVIASGLAQGIDAAAHRGALDADEPTVAIMGTGLDRTFPAAHRDLRERIRLRGCVVSEYGAEQGAHKYHFPRRNRLIAALAEGVLIIEAPERSGALITAELALDLGREILVVPGPVDDERYRGSHRLIRQGAALVENAAQVAACLEPPRRSARESDVDSGRRPPRLSPVERRLWERLDLEGVPLTTLAAHWPASGESLAGTVVELEMRGLIQRLPGGLIARKIWRP